MLVLDIPQRSPANFAYVEVPIYHRVHLSLAADIPVYGCLLEGTNQSHQPELIIAPFDFANWNQIWRLNLALRDRAGLLHEACEILLSNEVHILAAESSTVEEQDLFYLEMILNIGDEQSVEFVEWTLLSRFCKDIRLLPNGKPRLRMHRLEHLFHAKRAFEKQDIRPISFRPVKSLLTAKWSGAGETVAPGRLRSFRFELPKEMRDILKKQVRVENDREGYYLRLSDTKDRFLRIVFFRMSDPVIHCRIEYGVSSRSVTQITGALKQNGFSIITSYLSPSDTQGRSRMEVVARCNAFHGRTTEDLKRHLEAALGQPNEDDELRIEIGYPRNFGRKWDKHQIEPVIAARPEPRGISYNTALLLAEIKHTQGRIYDDLSRGAQIAGERPAHRYALVSRLIQHYDQSFGPKAGPAKSLFVSCHFHGDQLDFIEKQAKARDFHVVTGRNLLSDPTIVGGLLRRIRDCSHFLGVWSHCEDQPGGNESWPSPWILWELGVAEAFELEWRLLISERIEKTAWNKVAPHRQHATFGENDFESQVGIILDVLLSLPAKALRSPKYAST